VKTTAAQTPDNHHYGLTTLLTRQVALRNGEAVFDYVGKAEQRQRLSVSDPDARERVEQAVLDLLSASGKT
jgi:DNA topoisomerase IB